MNAFPFTEAEWASVQDAALPVVNATLAGDAVLHASSLIGLWDVLGELRERHGDHPALLETWADFTEDDMERIALYRQAADTASIHGLQTLSIRLSLAKVLLRLGRPEEATVELSACARELPDGDESERASWAGMVAEAKSTDPTATPDWGAQGGTAGRP